MEGETKKELMEFESALQEEFATQDKLTYKPDLHEPFFKKPELFICSFCDKKFTRLDHLKRHAKIHTDEKPFSCSKCDKKFRALGNLKVH